MGGGDRHVEVFYVILGSANHWDYCLFLMKSLMEQKGKMMLPASCD
jgi:hypothetical protein